MTAEIEYGKFHFLTCCPPQIVVLGLKQDYAPCEWVDPCPQATLRLQWGFEWLDHGLQTIFYCFFSPLVWFILEAEEFFLCMLPSVHCFPLGLFSPGRVICRVAVSNTVFHLSPGSAARCSAMDLAEVMSIVSPVGSTLRGSGLSCCCGSDWFNTRVHISEKAEHRAFGFFPGVYNTELLGSMSVVLQDVSNLVAGD